MEQYVDMEYLRGIKVIIEIETNKRGYKGEFVLQENQSIKEFIKNVSYKIKQQSKIN